MTATPWTPPQTRPAHLHQQELTNDQRAQIKQVMDGFEGAMALSERDRQFLQGNVERYRKHGIFFAVTDRQWAWFESIHRKMFPKESTK